VAAAAMGVLVWHASSLLWLLGSDGPGGLEQLGRSDRVGLTDVGSAQKKMKGLLFSEFNFQCENNFRKSRNYFKVTKNTQKIPKTPRKFPEIVSDTNNPNKIFGAHEKDFRAF
jgi:hypothetical protein